jgi:hypothetical protein
MGISNVVESVLGKNTNKTVKMNVIGASGTYYVEGREFDCVVSINHTLSNTITDNPVEFGTPVTDNIFKNQRIYTLSGVVSPYGDVTLGGVSVADVGIPALSSKNNAQDWYSGLIEISNLSLGGLIRLTIYPESYPNLAVQSLVFKDSYKIGEGIEFTMTLKEVIVATSSISNGSTNNPSNPINNDSVSNGTAPVTNVLAAEVV